jgi:hypothetical protein
MSKEVLQIIGKAMKSLGLQYGFGEYGGDAEGQIVYPYFVGEYMETESTTEDGLQETTFILTGFSRDSWEALEEAKEKIEKHFSLSGRVGITSSGSAVAIFYAHSLIVPTSDAELKSIQINLSIKEWKVI